MDSGNLAAQRILLQVLVALVAGTLLVCAILIGSTLYQINTGTASPIYLVMVGIAHTGLLVSLLVGGKSLLNLIADLNCQQWNVRMVYDSVKIEILLLLASLALYTVALFFVYAH